MPEEKRDEYQIIAYRCDLVTIPISEYKELIITAERSTAKADQRLSDWCKERERADMLSVKVKELEAEIESLKVEAALRKQVHSLESDREDPHYA